MRTRLEPLTDLTDADFGAWAALSVHALEPNPYFAPDFVRAAARGLGRDDVGVLIAGDWEGALPVVRQRSWRRVPLPALTTWLHSYCLLGTPLVASAAAAEALVAGGRADRDAAFLALEWVGTDGPVAAALTDAVAAARVTERFERATLHRRAEPTYLEGRMSSKKRKELRRLRRALARELGADAEVRDRTGEQAAVEDFLRLEASGWKGREGTAMASVAGHDTFFREVCASFAAAGRLEVLSLEADGRPVAMQCNLLAGDALFCFKVAYDDELSRFSVGVQLEVEAIDVFHAHPERAWMDSCADPDNELINGLWPDRRAIATFALPAAARLRLATKPAIAAVEAARRIKTRVR